MRRALFALAFPFMCVATAPAALAQDYPKLKSGQWEMTLTQQKAAAGSAAPSKTTLCMDDALQKEMTGMGAGVSRELCTKNEIRREGSRYVGLSECNIGGSRVVSRTVMTLTGDTGYRTEIDSTYDPPMMGTKSEKTLLEGKYVGACRDGLVPGDVVAPGGQKFNVKSLGVGKAPAPSSQTSSKPKGTQ